MKRILLITVVLLAASCSSGVKTAVRCNLVPDIFPDYIDVTVPATIAPLDFSMADETVSRIDVTVTGSAGGTLHVSNRGAARFPIRRWHKLLAANAGGDLAVAVAAKYPDGWRSFEPFTVHVSTDPVDAGLAYRLICPGFSAMGYIGIFQRDLSSFKESSILELREFNACMNCHTFRQTDPDYFTFHIRGPHGGTFIKTPDGGTDLYNTKTDSTIANCTYPYWHPSGRYIAYSCNRSVQDFHQRADKILEVYDLASDLNVYDVTTGELTSDPCVSRPELLENFPVFSADGKTIYFTCAKIQSVESGLESVRYNLCKVSFDPETGTIGRKVDTLFLADQAGKSVMFPKPSYDGRYLMFNMADYGTFSTWHPEADLWLYDLATDEMRPLTEANSPRSETDHSWSSNSRWFVFGSRRDNNLFTFPYICHIDENGNCTKPFLLPQRNPREFYDSRFKSYNIPEFISAPVDFDREKAVRLIKSDRRTKFKFRPNPTSGS